jgi:hypothetical protein
MARAARSRRTPRGPPACDFLKTAGVEQARDALAYSEFALGTVSRYRIRTAALLRQPAPAVDFLDIR